MAVSKRFPTDHHGPLVPPPAFAGASLAGADLDAAIVEIAIQQQDAWISLATDGELRRRHGATDPVAEARFLAANSPMAVKLRLPAPAEGAPLADKATLDALLAAGVRYIQLDGSAYAPLLHGAGRAAVRAAGGDPDAILAARVAADAAVLGAVNVEDGVKLAIALHDVTDPASRPFGEDLDRAAAKSFFHGIGANRFLFDVGASGTRDYGFLADLPDGTEAVLGLFDADAELPDADTLVAEIDRAATIIDTDRLALSPRHSLLASLTGTAVEAWQKQKQVLDYVLDVATRSWGIDF